MKKLKPYFRILAALSCLVILALGAVLYSFNRKITEGLAKKKFLPPTEYYSAPLEVSSSRPVARAEFKNILGSRHYRVRDWNEKLFPGDFSETTLESCQSSVPIPLPQGTAVCLLLTLKETNDPEMSQIPLQMLTFDSGDKLTGTLQGNPLQISAKIGLEPELVAQYLDEQPIMQTYQALGEIPTQCLNAVLAIEDSKFLEHSGISYTGIARALISNIFGGRVRQGGSTITQQLVKNYFLTSEKTFKRKITEFAMSFLLEAHASKDEILETYLNVIYLGQNGPFQVRGFGAASQYYFNKPLGQLELHECSMLAAVLNSPGLYDPFRKSENALKRRSLVLERMKELNMISAEEQAAAKAQALPIERKMSINETAPYYINAANHSVEDLGFDLRGLKIFTGLVLQEQQAAQEAVRGSLADLEAKNPKIKALKAKGLNLEGVLVSAHNDSGMISAIVGGRGYKLTQFNRATEAHRQVGSIMKPFVFLTALLHSGQNGKTYDPLTILNDRKFSYAYEGQSWSPDNYGKKYYGQVPMYFALKNSLNAATASLGLEVGLAPIVETAKALGVKSQLNQVPSLTLGAFELYPVEVLEAYTALARFGNHIPLSSVRAVTDLQGQKMFRYEVHPEQKIPAPAVASLISMMKQTVQSGTAKLISLSGYQVPAAGKTGTTSDNKDAWFAGMTPQQTTVVWVGYDTPTTDGLTGASAPVPIWLQFMTKIANGNLSDFSWPEQVDIRMTEVHEPEVEAKSQTVAKTETNLEAKAEVKTIELIFQK